MQSKKNLFLKKSFYIYIQKKKKKLYRKKFFYINNQKKKKKLLRVDEIKENIKIFKYIILYW